jgi:hypothetical protein
MQFPGRAEVSGVERKKSRIQIKLRPKIVTANTS